MSNHEPNARAKGNAANVHQMGGDSFETAAVFVVYVFVIITFPITIFFCLKVILEYERAVIFRFGKLREKQAKGPGLIFLLPCIDECFIVDLRTEVLDVYPQAILTKDSVNIILDAVVVFRAADPILGVVSVGDYRYSTMLLAQATLRNIAGTKTLLELLTEREDISRMLQELLDEATDVWGIKVERVEVRDIRLPSNIHRSMAAEAEAAREAKAKLVAAQGEMLAADALKKASDILCSNSVAIQLRYLQTLHMVSMNDNSTFIIPFPAQLGRGLVNSGVRLINDE